VVRTLKILVVDDFEDFRRFVCSVLQQRAEFEITEASDGLDAVRKAKELQPDLILLDIGLPNLNGLEVAKRVRGFGPGKILFLSALSDPEVVRKALSIGALGYVHKPSAQSDLMPAIDAILGGTLFVGKGLEFSEDKNVQAFPETHHRHEILFCSDGEALLVGLTDFISSALNAGNPAIVWATQSDRASLLQRLRAHGVNIDAALQRGTFISSDIAEPPDLFRMRESIRSLCVAAAKVGKNRPRVAVCGERAGRMWAEGKMDEAVRLEQLLNELAKNYDLDILCPYPSPQGQDDHNALKSICAEHSAFSYR
jgi:CheY-like chemotaxis protein